MPTATVDSLITCRKCGVPKPREAFYVSRRGSICKACCCAKAADRYRTNTDYLRERGRAYNRQRYLSNPDHEREIQRRRGRKYGQRKREARLAKREAWQASHPNLAATIDAEIAAQRTWKKERTAERERQRHSDRQKEAAQKHRDRYARFWRGRVSADARPGVIYCIKDPRSGLVRYIGQSANLKRRAAQYRRGHAHNTHLRRLIAKWMREGLKFSVEVLETCLFGLDDAEIKWIATAREKGWPIVNVAEGGSGFTPIDDERRRKIGERSRRQWQDPVWRAKWMATAEKRFAEVRAKKQREREERRLTREMERIEKENAPAARERERLNAFGVLTPLTRGAVGFVPLTNGAWAIVDADNLERVLKYRWGLQMKGPYRRAKRTVHLPGRRKGIELLNRFIVGARPNEFVRHVNGNQLDCRSSNLRGGAYV
jgi:hypothetical protein